MGRTLRVPRDGRENGWKIRREDSPRRVICGCAGVGDVGEPLNVGAKGRVACLYQLLLFEGALSLSTYMSPEMFDLQKAATQRRRL